MKRFRPISLLALGLLLAVAFFGTQPAFGQDATIPTRTPTPGSSNPNPTATSQPQPTSPPEPQPTNPPNPNPQPTNEPAPQPTNTPISTATAVLVTNTPVPTTEVIETATAVSGEGSIPEQVPTPSFPTTGGFPPAASCEDYPTVTAVDEVTVYAGPGTDYAEITLLIEDEVKPLIGRAQYAEWWLIQLDADGLTGWVADEDVDEQGNTGNVPLVVVPEIDGLTPTPGILWNPTPQPACTTPTPTATATATPEPSPTPIQTATPVATAETDNTSDSDEQATVGDDTVIPTAEPLEVDQESSSTPNFLPIVGVGLLAVAVFAAFFIRSRSTSPGEDE